MNTRLRKSMLVFGTTILVIQAVLMPIGGVYAGEYQEQLEMPPIKSYLEEEQTNDPRFFFSCSHIQGIVKEQIQVTFFADQEVSEVHVSIPEQATLSIEQLPIGLSVEGGTKSGEWVIQAESAQSKFVLPLVFDIAGSYELKVGNITTVIEIRKPEIKSENESSIKESLSSENSSDKQDSQGEKGLEGQGKSAIDSYDFTDSIMRESLPLSNQLFSYAEDDELINGWSLFMGPGVLGRIENLSLSNIFDASSEFRYALDGEDLNERVLFRKSSDNQGLRVKIQEDTTLIAGQKIQTTPGTEYLVRGDFSGNSRRALLVYEGEKFAGADGITSETISDGLREVTFEAASSVYTITARLFALSGENSEESSINYVNVGEKINLDIVYIDEFGKEIHDNDYVYGIKGEAYEIEPIEIPGYVLKSSTEIYKGILSESGTVTFQYMTEVVYPKDPLDPEAEADPENKPELPEDQGLLSIDFVSSFNFGTQTISAQDQTYYAQPQRLMNDDQTVNENEERPNYVQVSDRRSDDQATGWQLAVTQETQFATAQNKELTGASLSLSNQQLATSQGGIAPTLQVSETVVLTPGHKRVLLKAGEEEGKGTWIYRFGDRDTLGESVALDIPIGTTAEAAAYSTTFTWELSAVPGNK